MKRTLQAKLLILAVFAVGALTGAVLMDVYETRVFSDDDQSGRRGRFLGGVSYGEYLELTAEQEARVAAILEGTRDGFRELRGQTRPLYQELKDTSRGEIRELLTESQRELYDQWIEEERQREADRALRQSGR